MLENITGYIELALLVIGAAATVVKGLEVFAGITPTDKDDKALGVVKHYLAVASYWLDKLSLAVQPKK